MYYSLKYACELSLERYLRWYVPPSTILVANNIIESTNSLCSDKISLQVFQTDYCEFSTDKNTTSLESSCQAAFDGAGGAYYLCGFYVANRR